MGETRSADRSPEANRIKFLGTAGARFVVTKQLRASGGVWYTLDGTNILLDPGPGSLVRALSSRPPLDPTRLDGIILSHRHIDHSCDVNIMMEAMTEGGSRPRGLVFAPSEALETDPVIHHYVRSYVAGVVPLEEGGGHALGTIHFSTPLRHRHPVETYGIRLEFSRGTISHIVDTLYFPELADHHRSDVLILHTVLLEKKPGVYHLDLQDAIELIGTIRPRQAILTHFGMGMLRAHPWELAERVQQKTGIPTLAARDGMDLTLDEILA